MPNGRDNNLPSSKPQPSTTTTWRRPSSNIRDKWVWCKNDFGWSGQLSWPLANVVIQTNETPADCPRKPKTYIIWFNGTTTTSLGDIVLPVQVGMITQNVQFSIVEDLSHFNTIMERTWLHNMKVIPSTYHQMVSYLTEDGQIDLYGSRLATC